MAQYQQHFTGSFEKLLAYLDQEILHGSVTASKEGGTEMACGDVRCAVRVYERYSTPCKLSLFLPLFRPVCAGCRCLYR